MPAHILPFPNTDQIMQQMTGAPWAGFWRELKPAFDYFEETGRVPQIAVSGKSYVVSAAE